MSTALAPTVAILHQTMRCARSMNSASVSRNDETRIDDPSELESSRAGIEGVPKTVAEQVEAEDCQGDGHTGNDRSPGRQLQEAVGGADHRTPARRGWLVAETEEG